MVCDEGARLRPAPADRRADPRAPAGRPAPDVVERQPSTTVTRPRVVDLARVGAMRLGRRRYSARGQLVARELRRARGRWSASSVGRRSIRLPVPRSRRRARRIVRRDPDDDRVVHTGRRLQDGLDLFGIHLLAAGVDALRATPEQVHRAVGVDRRHVAGQRPAVRRRSRRTCARSAPGPCSTRAGPGRGWRAGRRRRTRSGSGAGRRRRRIVSALAANVSDGGAAEFRVVTATACAGDSDEPMPSTMREHRSAAAASSSSFDVGRRACCRPSRAAAATTCPSAPGRARSASRSGRRGRVADEVQGVDPFVARRDRARAAGRACASVYEHDLPAAEQRAERRPLPARVHERAERERDELRRARVARREERAQPLRRVVDDRRARSASGVGDRRAAGIPAAERGEEDVLVAPHDALRACRWCRRCRGCSGRRRERVRRSRDAGRAGRRRGRVEPMRPSTSASYQTLHEVGVIGEVPQLGRRCSASSR